MNALTKVETPLMERYETKCCHCGWVRHFFGMEKEARESALKMGWEFRMANRYRSETIIFAAIKKCSSEEIEVAYCPHCKILVKP